jgi:hypothetical protein
MSIPSERERKEEEQTDSQYRMMIKSKLTFRDKAGKERESESCYPRRNLHFLERCCDKEECVCVCVFIYIHLLLLLFSSNRVELRQRKKKKKTSKQCNEGDTNFSSTSPLFAIIIKFPSRTLLRSSIDCSHHRRSS